MAPESIPQPIKPLRVLNQIRDTFWVDNNVKQAFNDIEALLKTDGLSPQEQQAIIETAGLFCRYRRNFAQAIKHYARIPDYFQAGYCALLMGDLKQVETYWTPLVKANPTHWCAHLYGMISQQLQTVPTLLQIRNYLEQDICHLLQNNQIQFAENLLAHAHYLAQINPESYKLIGRSLTLEKRYKQAEYFLRLGQKNLPQDPEVYYHLGEILALLNRPTEAALMLKQCLLISSVYHPARELLNSLTPTNQPS